MTSKHALYVIIFFSLFICYSCSNLEKHSLISAWDDSSEGVFLGKELWGNRLQDWQAKNGRLECINGQYPLRTVHVLTHEINNMDASFRIDVKVGLIHNQTIEDEACAGLLIGAGSLDIDYRGRSLIFGRPGENGGLIAGINGRGELTILDIGKNLEVIAKSEQVPGLLERLKEGCELTFSVKPAEGNFTGSLTENKTGTSISFPVSKERITGNVGVVAHLGYHTGDGSFWFKDLQLSGPKLSYYAERTLGPIVSTLHTLSRNILKMSAQMMPVGPNEPDKILLRYKDQNTENWENEISSVINRDGYVAVFKIEDWDDTRNYDYEIAYDYTTYTGDKATSTYQGTIRKNPVDKDEIIIAAFTGNNNTSWQSNKFDRTSLFFPHEDLTARVAMQKPDFLFYSGDQLYESSPSQPDRSGGLPSELDYLYKWYLWCWAHRNLTKDIPAVAIPDDHDVFHGNVWGAGGELPPQSPPGGIYPERYRGGYEEHWVQDQGGYRMGTKFVNMVQRTQTSNLPDPIDPRPAKNNIGVYFTDINYGRIGFAVLEDRKFKSAPAKVLPDAEIINGFSQIEGYDATKADREDAQLLGQRQLDFLNNWVNDWRDTWMKVSLSQTILADVVSFPDSFKIDDATPRLPPLPQGVIPKDFSVAKDMDSNGWPQSGRNRALKALRRGFTLMIAGDQHLGTVVHHGVDDWEDAGISLCVPSVANVWPRRWFPPEPGLNHQEGRPGYTGRYFDGFGNRITVFAASNPYISNVYPAELNDRAPGYGIVKLYKKEQKIVIECWPRHVDPSQPGAKQYPDWPLTFNLMDNYGRQATGWLPTITTSGLSNPPVIQVVDENNGEKIYTVRVGSNSFDPKVFKRGNYTINVGEPGTENWKTLTHITSGSQKGARSIKVEF